MEQAALEAGQKSFSVWPENWTAITIFLRMSSQFHFGSMGGATGLNYQSVEFLFRIFKVKDKADTFDRLRIMEREALTFLNRK